MKYEELLRLLENKLNNLKSSYKLLLPDNSWVTEAIDNVKNLIIAKQNKIPEKEYFNREELLYQKTVTSLSELHDLNRIISFFGKPVILNVIINKEGISPITNQLTVGFQATTTIKRSDFGMTTLLPGLGDTVKIDIAGEAFKGQ